MPDSTVISVPPGAKVRPDAGKAMPGKRTDVPDPFGALCLDPMTRFFGIQARLLHETRLATDAWFDRHQKRNAVHLEAAAKIGASRDAVEIADIYRRWLAGTLAQLVEDAHDGGKRWIGFLRAFTFDPKDEEIRDRSGGQHSGDPTSSRAA